jgi:MMP alpha-(1->4)-mannosyltransferase
MRCLLFAQQWKSFTSGLGTYARGLALGLRDRGHEVTLATAKSQVEDVEGIRILPMAFTPWNVSPFTWRRMSEAYRTILETHAADHELIHCLDAREAAFLKKAPGVPTIGTVHDTYAVDWKGAGKAGRTLKDRFAERFYYGWLRNMERVAYFELTRLIANSDHVSGFLASGYGVAPEKVDVVRIGLPDASAAAPEELAGDPAVLFVGGNFRRKGLPELLRAVAETVAASPEIRLHVIGRDRREERYHTMAATLGISDRVEFHGHRENDRVRAMMAGADVFAMPSLVEAFGLVYLEAMRAGTPVIATANGGAAECFVDGEELLLAPPGDAGAVAGLIGRLMREEGLRERLIEGGRKAILRYPLESTVTGTINAYGRALS